MVVRTAERSGFLHTDLLSIGLELLELVGIKLAFLRLLGFVLFLASDIFLSLNLVPFMYRILLSLLLGLWLFATIVAI